MAFFTGNILMSAIKFKSSFIMIEIARFPVPGIMAGGAISFPVLFKLVKMIVSMAPGTFMRQSCEFLAHDPFVIFSEMTSAAILPGMCTCQIKAGYRMIK